MYDRFPRLKKYLIFILQAEPVFSLVELASCLQFIQRGIISLQPPFVLVMDLKISYIARNFTFLILVLFVCMFLQLKICSCVGVIFLPVVLMLWNKLCSKSCHIMLCSFFIFSYKFLLFIKYIKFFILHNFWVVQLFID